MRNYLNMYGWTALAFLVGSTLTLYLGTASPLYIVPAVFLIEQGISLLRVVFDSNEKQQELEQKLEFINKTLINVDKKFQAIETEFTSIHTAQSIMERSKNRML